MRKLANVPFTCKHCGNVERFPETATVAEAAVEPCAKCGKIGKLPPVLKPKGEPNAD